MNCKCIQKIDAQLKPQNLQMSGFSFICPKMELVPYITCSWIDRAKAPKGKRNRPPYMFASHCPWCGKPIKKPESRKKNRRSA